MNNESLKPLLSICLSLIVVLGLLTIATVYIPPTTLQEDSPLAKSTSPRPLDLSEPATKRNLASDLTPTPDTSEKALEITNSSSTEKSRPKKLDQLLMVKKKIDCHALGDFKVDTKVHQILLEGENCSHDIEMTITNTSTGISSTLFYLGKRSFQTDLIQLQPGENTIEIIHQLDDQMQIQQFTVTRGS